MFGWFIKITKNRSTYYENHEIVLLYQDTVLMKNKIMHKEGMIYWTKQH